jgi:hypothetical protein
MIGFGGSEMPDEVRGKLRGLCSNDALRVIDALCYQMKLDRTIDRQAIKDLTPERSQETGGFVHSLLVRARAARAVSASPSGGHGYLFEGDQIPVLEDQLSPGNGLVAVLLEHRWATPLRDAVVDSDAVPVADVWVGQTALQDLELMPQGRPSA